MNTTHQLIGYNLCPFVARVRIVATEKSFPLELSYIDIAAKPDWFTKLSPTGQVPALLVGDRVLFESSAISSYIDEVTPGSLFPTDVVRRAEIRAWTQFASDLTLKQYAQMCATTESMLQEVTSAVDSALAILAKNLAAEGGFFDGDEFGMADAAFASFLFRAAIFDKKFGLSSLARYPRLVRWQESVCSRPSVNEYFSNQFVELMLGHMETKESILIR